MVGRDLAQSVARPLAHLAIPSERPDLTIDLWDAEESQVPSPLVATSNGPGAVSSSPDGRFLVYERPDSVMALDRADGHLVGCFESSRRLALADRARPLNVPFTVWCSDRGVHLVHAGLVAIDGQGVLLAGFAGAGKSTAALACACAGFEFLGEDFVALSRSPEGGFEGHSVYSSTLIEPGHLAGFPPLPDGTTDDGAPGDEKSLLFLDQVARVAPIRLVALPQISSSDGSRARRATPGEALRRLAPGSLVKRAMAPQAGLRGMARLVDQVPTYWLQLDRELHQIPRRVERLLGEAGVR